MATDLEIAREAKLEPIENIARTAGFLPETVSPYGRYVAKIDQRAYADLPQRAKLVLVTAINPTPAGEGKTTVSVALADGMRCIGKNAMLALREPSLGPVFGMKGGATGGGWAQVVPMESINLHFTGDLHAITAANNLLCAMVDNHIYQGNALNIDPRRITWKRCVDMNDRQLRNIVDGLGGRMQGVPREDGFDITVASEIMAVLCLATSITDLKARLGRMVVGYTYEDKPVTANDLKVLYTLYDHLALPAEVICLLVNWCIEEMERKYGPGRRPRMSQIRREGFVWHRLGVDTPEAADAHLRHLTALAGRERSLLPRLGISGRAPVEGERKYIAAWVDLGFDDETICLAYERTVLKKGSLNWAYMNSILKSWHQKGLHTVEQVESGDSAWRRAAGPAAPPAPDL